jgi:hypothetical protein
VWWCVYSSGPTRGFKQVAWCSLSFEHQYEVHSLQYVIGRGDVVLLFRFREVHFIFTSSRQQQDVGSHTNSVRGRWSRMRLLRFSSVFPSKWQPLNALLMITFQYWSRYCGKAAGWTIRGSSPGSAKNFFFSVRHAYRLWDPLNLLFNGHRGSFRGGGTGGAWNYPLIPLLPPCAVVEWIGATLLCPPVLNFSSAHTTS